MGKIVWFAAIISLLCWSAADAQLWRSVGAGVDQEVKCLKVDTIGNQMFACGNFDFCGDTFANNIGRYDGIAWHRVGDGLGDPIPGIGGIAWSLEYYGNELFVSGEFVKIGGVQLPRVMYLARWDGANWLECGNPNAGVGLKELNGKLLAFGAFDSISGQNVMRVASWDGSNWVAFGGLTPFQPHDNLGFSSAEFYQGSYYFGGNFSLPNGWNEIIRWDGSQWQTLGTGLLGNAASVTALATYKGLLFVGGTFLESAGNASDFLVAWDGNQWLDPFPDVQFNSQIRSLKEINGELYIVGEHYFSGLSRPHWLAHFDGNQFCSFGQGEGGTTSLIAGDADRLFVGGSYFASPTDTIYLLAEWLGENSTDTCLSSPLAVVDSEEGAQRMAIYPVPCGNSFSLNLAPEIGPFKLRILGMDGVPVSALQEITSGSDIDVSNLPSGFYSVEVRFAKQTTYLKLAKE